MKDINVIHIDIIHLRKEEEKMKRMKCIALTLVLCLLLGMNVSAAEKDHYSIGGNFSVGAVTGLEIDGVDDIYANISETNEKDTPSQDECKTILGVSTDCTVYMWEVWLEDENGNSIVIPAGKSATIRFGIPGVTANSKVIVRHWKSDGTVENLTPSLIEDGHIEVAFTSLSPVAIIINNDSTTTSDPTPAPATTGSSSKKHHSSSSADETETTTVAAPASETITSEDSTKTSPKTGETSSVYVIELVALAALLGAAYTRKKLHE